MKKICPGFTLIELLITISIMSILFSLGMAQYMKFNRQQVLKQALLELKTNLTNAQSMALAGKKTCDGAFDGILVYFPDDISYTVHSSCDNKDPSELPVIKSHRFPQGVKRADGPEKILFKTLTGGTNLKTEETIALDGLADGLKVAPSGKIELE